MIRIPSGVYYTPDDLGLNAVNVGPTLSVIGNIVPINALGMGELYSVGLVKEQAAAGGTPADVLYANVNYGQAQWSDGLIQSSLWQNVTNNPRTQNARWTVVQTLVTMTTGASNAGEFAKLLNTPYGRFAWRNNDAVTASVLTLHVYLYFR